MADFDTLDVQALISRKICVIGKILFSHYNRVDSGVESRVSRVDFIQLTRSESSRKRSTHFEH